MNGPLFLSSCRKIVSMNSPPPPKNYLISATALGVNLEVLNLDFLGLDVCFVGVPLDAGTTNRSGTRMGPRQIRTESVIVRRFNNATGEQLWTLCIEQTIIEWKLGEGRGGGDPSWQAANNCRMGKQKPLCRKIRSMADQIKNWH